VNGLALVGNFLNVYGSRICALVQWIPKPLDCLLLPSGVSAEAWSQHPKRAPSPSTLHFETERFSIISLPSQS